MTTPLVIEYPATTFRSQHRYRQKADDVPTGRVPRLARLLALALKIDALVGAGTIRNYADLARLGHVRRARVSQLLSLVRLAPDIQEAILFLPLTRHGRDPIALRHVLPITLVPSWKRQRRLWQKLQRQTKAANRDHDHL
jgi:hypothetical protein